MLGHHFLSAQPTKSIMTGTLFLCWLYTCVLITLNQAIDYFVSTPKWYEDLGDLKLSPAEWLVLSDFKIILKVCIIIFIISHNWSFTSIHTSYSKHCHLKVNHVLTTLHQSLNSSCPPGRKLQVRFPTSSHGLTMLSVGYINTTSVWTTRMPMCLLCVSFIHHPSSHYLLQSSCWSQCSPQVDQALLGHWLCQTCWRFDFEDSKSLYNTLCHLIECC